MVETERRIKVAGLADYYQGPKEFDEVVSFGKSLEGMRGSVVPIEERVKVSSQKLQFTGFEDARVARIYNEITAIVNTSTSDDPEARFRYQSAMARFYSELGGQEKGIFIAVLRAGRFVSCFYPLMKTIEIEGKRLPMSNGEMQLGLIGSLPYDGLNNQRVIIGEGCVATGLTVAGILESINRNGVRPDIVEVHALAVSQRGAEYILTRAEELSIHLKIVGGMSVFAMNDHFYLLRVSEEGWLAGTFAVGDAGDYTMPLPPEYNDRAWWNKNRISPHLAL